MHREPAMPLKPPTRRYVVLEHTHDGIHYVLMCEVGSALRTWRLSSPPSVGQRQTAEASFDHRLLYLEYEGPIGADAGHVVRWDHGCYEGDAAGEDSIQLAVHGVRLDGIIELVRQTGTDWVFTYRKP